MARRRRAATGATEALPQAGTTITGGDANELARAIPDDFELTPEVEAAIDALALAGRADPDARNALYGALTFKIARFLAPYRGRAHAAGEFADVEQEAFVVFAGLVADWPGSGTFARYFLGYFPWRLRHAVEAHERRWPRDRLLVIPHEAYGSAARRAPRPDPAPEVDLAVELGPLTDEERRLLALRILEDRALDEIAPLFGWSRRTAFRRWRALLDRLGRELGAA